MSNVPKLRFSEFDGEYKEYLFSDIFLFSTGKNIKQKEASPKFETPCIRYGELYHMYKEVIYKIINKTNINKSELCFSKGDEILLPSAGEDPLDIGSASALTLKNIAIGRTINILRPMDKNVYSQKYMAYYINEKLKRKISTLAKGSSISNVYNSDLKSLKSILPILEEQQKIANFLTSIDKKIELLESKITHLERYKKGLMQKIFSNYTELELRSGKLIDFGYFYYGKSAPKFSLSDTAETPCVRYGELYSTYGEYISKIKSYTEIERNKLKFSKGGEILIPRVGEDPLEFANCSYLPFADVAIGEMISVYNTEENGLFMTYYINAMLKYEFAKVVEGGNVSNLYFKYLEHIIIKIPSLKEQQKIANFLSSIDKKIEQTQKALEEMKAFKKGLLQGMFV